MEKPDICLHCGESNFKTYHTEDESVSVCADCGRVKH